MLVFDLTVAKVAEAAGFSEGTRADTCPVIGPFLAIFFL